MIEDIPEFQMAEKEVSRLKEENRFYKDRLRPISDPETGATEDEIDRLTLALELTSQDKKRFATNYHDLRCAVREALVIIEGNKCDLSQGASSHEVLHNAGVQRDMDIIIKNCGEFL